MWLAPRQAVVLTVSSQADQYAEEVWAALRAQGIRVDKDCSADKLGAKIRNARLARYPYLCVVGRKEEETRSVGVRSREEGELGSIPLDLFVNRLAREAKLPAVSLDPLA